MTITAFDLGQRFIGVKEVAGTASNPLILAMLRLDANWPNDDSVAWCSAWISFIAWLLRLPRSKSLAARSWLGVGRPIGLAEARADADIVILQRGPSPQPGPDVIDAPGHVGFFARVEGDSVWVLGGNQGDGVSLARFPIASILGLRRLYA